MLRLRSRPVDVAAGSRSTFLISAEGQVSLPACASDAVGCKARAVTLGLVAFALLFECGFSIFGVSSVMSSANSIERL